MLSSQSSLATTEAHEDGRERQRKQLLMWLKTDCHTCEELPQEQEVLGSTTGGVTAAQWLFEGPHSSNTICKWLIIHTFSTSLLPMNNHLECSRGVSVSLALRCSWDSSPAQPDHIHRRAKHSCKLQLRREHAQLLLSTGTRSHSSTRAEPPPEPCMCKPRWRLSIYTVRQEGSQPKPKNATWAFSRHKLLVCQLCVAFLAE